jgi:hypothetical protein
MLADAFGAHIPQWVSPASTSLVIAFFFWRSVQEQRLVPAAI